MRKLAGLSASLLLAATGGTAMAGSALDVLGDNISPGSSLVFNDFTYSLVPPGSGGDLSLVPVDADVTAYFTIETIGTGGTVPFLDQSTAFAGSTDSTGAEGIAVEGKISALVGSNGGAGGILSLKDVIVDVYFGDDSANDTVGAGTTLLGADALFTDETKRLTFESDGGDDFYNISLNTSGFATAFEFGLTNTANSTGFDIISQILSPTFAGAEVDIFGAGTLDFDNISQTAPTLTGAGDIFHQGSGNRFAVAFVPSPTAAGGSMLMIGVAALRRRRKA